MLYSISDYIIFTVSNFTFSGKKTEQTQSKLKKMCYIASAANKQYFSLMTNHSRGGGGEATGGRVRPDSSTATQEQAATEQQPASSGEANPDTISGLEQS